MSLLEIKGVSVDYAAHGSGLWRKARSFRAAAEVSLTIEAGQTVALVGESESGKSTIGRVAGSLLRPSEGEVWFMGRRMDTLSGSALRTVRASIGFIFQDPYASLNPRHRIMESIALPLRLHTSDPAAVIRSRVSGLLERVGLTPVDRYARAYPHQLSGGQRQRVAIARAIAVRPTFIVADEPVSSLDVSVSSQILNLLQELQRDLQIGYLFISHDLGVVQTLADHLAVMYQGKVVEEGSPRDVLLTASHPYTQMLVASVPELLVLDTTPEVPPSSSPGAAIGGCAFRHRCPFAFDRCAVEEPMLLTVDGAHRSKCFLGQPDGPRPEAWLRARERFDVEPATLSA